jgi:hypothetical protein
MMYVLATEAFRSHKRIFFHFLFKWVILTTINADPDPQHRIQVTLKTRF